MSKMAYLQPNELKAGHNVMISYSDTTKGVEKSDGIVKENPLRLEMKDGSIISIPDLWVDYKEGDSCFIPVRNNNIPEVWSFEVVEGK